MRLLYVLIGGYTATAAFLDSQWLIGLVGIGFASMGVFALGCAAGNCFTRSCQVEQQSPSDTEEIEYEEVT